MASSEIQDCWQFEKFVDEAQENANFFGKLRSKKNIQNSVFLFHDNNLYHIKKRDPFIKNYIAFYIV
jgi:hypothetical protein